eukprot:3367096-Prymnesium_polylepis.1
MDEQVHLHDVVDKRNVTRHAPESSEKVVLENEVVVPRLRRECKQLTPPVVIRVQAAHPRLHSNWRGCKAAPCQRKQNVARRSLAQPVPVHSEKNQLRKRAEHNVEVRALHRGPRDVKRLETRKRSRYSLHRVVVYGI